MRKLEDMKNNIDNIKKEPIHVYNINENMYIGDGHHRAILLDCMGYEYIRAKIKKNCKN